jgi:hypothetical protein
MITAVYSKPRPTVNQFDENGDDLSYRLSVLDKAHSKLDDEILQLYKAATVDQIKMIRLKKVKLNLKEQIEKLHSSLYPDIIA